MNVNKNIAPAAALVVALAGMVIGATNYTVRPGDTLESIGKQHGVSAERMAKANDIANPKLIQPGLVLKIPDADNAPRRYTVKAGDTLGSIAAEMKTTVTALSDINKIEDPKTLKAGQVLLVPTNAALVAAKPVEAERHPLPASLRRQLDPIPVTKGKWKYIVVHHSAAKNGNMQGMDMYHRQKRKMENGLAYHFVIGNGHGIPDGKIEIGNRWKRQIKGGHLASDELNQVAIGICLVGNFETERPSAAQMQSLYALVSYLSRRCGIPKSRVQTHQQINTKPTACPGRKFPMSSLLDNI